MTPAQPNNLIIKPLRRNRSTSNIFIPTSARERTNYARVLSVGPNVTTLAPDDIVLIDGDHGRPIDNPTDPDNPLRDIFIDHILAVIKGDPE